MSAPFERDVHFRKFNVKQKSELSRVRWDLGAHANAQSSAKHAASRRYSGPRCLLRVQLAVPSMRLFCGQPFPAVPSVSLLRQALFNCRVPTVPSQRRFFQNNKHAKMSVSSRRNAHFGMTLRWAVMTLTRWGEVWMGLDWT